MLKREIIIGTKHNETRRPLPQHCCVGKLTKPKVQRNLLASEPVAPRDPSFLWVGFPLCGLLPADLSTALRADTSGLVWLADSKVKGGSLSSLASLHHLILSLLAPVATCVVYIWVEGCGSKIEMIAGLTMGANMTKGSAYIKKGAWHWLAAVPSPLELG